MEIHLVGAMLIHVDIWTDMTNLTDTFFDYMNMPKNRMYSSKAGPSYTPSDFILLTGTQVK
jgi:hypothetical protein